MRIKNRVLRIKNGTLFVYPAIFSDFQLCVAMEELQRYSVL